MTTNAMSTDTRVIAKQTQTAMSRLDQLEKLSQTIITGANTALSQFDQRMQAIEARGRAQNELLRAAIDLLGREAIDARVLVNRKADAEQQAENDKAQLAMLVSQGTAVVAEKVTNKSIVVGVEKKADGTVKDPGYTQAFTEGLPPELLSLLMDKVVGDTITLPGDAGTFEIQAVYTIVPPAAPEAPAPSSEEAPTSAAE